MNVRNIITFLTLLFLPAVAFAVGDDAENAQTVLQSALIKLILIIGFLVGLGTVIWAAYHLTLMSEQGQKNGKTKPVIGLIFGAVMMNATASLGVLGNTYFDVGEACYIISDGRVDDSCMSDATSGLTGELKARISKLSGDSTAQSFITHIKIIIGIFQTIGLTYFLIGAYGMKQVADGSSKDGGYGKPIITMLAAALIFDIPHTAQMAIDTLEKIGINF
ncbi:hypothetical protein [Pseudomonas proteolytica]|uniref:hypothetical protein n=1 Tax=Pseudomonas proteolytica TaxID=219574 RepID=UPI00320B1796